MKNRFEGEAGKRRLTEQLETQMFVGGDRILALELASYGEIIAVRADTLVIEEGAADNDIYFIIAGSCRIVVHGRDVAVRTAGTYVGEMSAIEPTQRRAATVIAAEDTILLKVTEVQFSEIGNKYPDVWRRIAKELARRLEQRNTHVSATHDRIRLFIMSSGESIGIAHAIQSGLQYDPYLVTVWTDGVFRAGKYSLESLETAVDESDFAIAIAHGDDIATVRGTLWPTPRDNVVFELGFFMGRLGRRRALLVEPRAEKVKLPSDLDGLTTISYRWSDDPKDLAAAIAPVCHGIREIVRDLGPNN